MLHQKHRRSADFEKPFIDSMNQIQNWNNTQISIRNSQHFILNTLSKAVSLRNHTIPVLRKKTLIVFSFSKSFHPNKVEKLVILSVWEHQIILLILLKF